MGGILNYAIPGVPYGCEFALLAVGLVLTFRATGVFNLAFGAQAFVSAYVFDLLNQYVGWSQPAAFLVSVVLLAPAIGWTLDHFLFRHIPTASMTVKVVSSLGLLIAIPQLIPVIFGPGTRYKIGYLWLNPNTVYFHIAGSPVNGGAISTTVITVVVVLALMALLRWTAAGLSMRAVVESRRLAQLEGVNSGRVASGAWMLSSLLAGLSGVLLLAQHQTLDPTSTLQFTVLLVAGITAACIASLRSLPIALAAGIGLGVLENVLKEFLTPGSLLAVGLLPSLPFIVMVAVLLTNRSLRTIEDSSDPLASVDPPPPPPAVTIRDPRLDVFMKWGFRVLVVGFVVSSQTWVGGNWVFAFAQGMVLSIMFLSITLITGMSGQLSLCQAAFAGIGAFVCGQLAQHFGFPVLLGALIGGALAAAIGTLVSMLVTRVSGLLLTLVTLAFALFADSVLFQVTWIGGGINGVTIPRPELFGINFANDRYFLLLGMVVLAVAGFMVQLVQRGTTGRFLAAMRGSPTAASSLGINLTYAKITVFALSAGIAGLGGAFYGSLQQAISPQDFQYVFSLIFVVVVITTGSKTVEGAIQAGIGYAVIAQVLSQVFAQLPPAWANHLGGIEIIGFAFGALTYAAHPEGIVEYQKSKWMARTSRWLRTYDARRASDPPAGAEALAAVPTEAYGA